MPTFKSKQYVKLKSILPSVISSKNTTFRESKSIDESNSKIYHQIRAMQAAKNFEAQRENKI